MASTNFAKTTVATAPSPATSGTSLVVAAGKGALFPSVPFNAVIWPTATEPTSTNAEIVTVTAVSTDTITITRAQEGTSARTIVVGDQIMFGLTAAVLDAVKNRVVTLVLDGGGSVLSTGQKGYIRFPLAGTITKASLFADVSGSAVVDVWKDTWANYPPLDADSITASATPTLSSAQKVEDSTLTGWTKTVAAGDVFGFNLDSCTTITRLVLEIEVTLT